MQNRYVEKIISGGQTGADRAALDVAIQLDIPHEGWCPKGRLAEDGTIPVHYQLRETPSTEYSQRTTWNVRDSDGTLVIVNGEPIGGTLLTIQMAQELKKPFLVFNVAEKKSKDDIIDWILSHNIRALNVAGPRASQDEFIYDVVCEVMRYVLSQVTV